MMNRVTVLGRVARDPLVRNTSQGRMVADFAVAVERKGGRFTQDGECEDLFRVRCWREEAQHAQERAQRGAYVAIDGRLEIDRYPQTSPQCDAVILVAEKLTILTSAPEILDVHELQHGEILNPYRCRAI